MPYSRILPDNLLELETLRRQLISHKPRDNQYIKIIEKKCAGNYYMLYGLCSLEYYASIVTNKE